MFIDFVYSIILGVVCYLFVTNNSKENINEGIAIYCDMLS